MELRKIEKGYVWAKGVEVLKGLQPGEEVIVESLEEFHPGDHVAVSVHPSDVVTAKL